jgi:First C2 domain of RPGR-interacting protein 1
MQRNTLKVDIYISKNNAAVHLGHAEINLRELIERETAVHDAAWRTPVVQKTVRVFGANKGVDQMIGNLRFKMRMRKPISEAARYFREKNEIENLKTLEGTTSSASRKKLVTIQVVACKDLSVKYGDVVQISPFFYYQFYNFDERYSATSAGKNPVFEDTMSYEVVFDAKMVHYLQRESLEIIIFDDSAPITGLSRGAQAAGEQAPTYRFD